jgi:hypothetical protein
MPAYADVSAVENRLVTEMLRRVASVRPDIAMTMAEILLDEREPIRIAHALTPAEAAFALSVVETVIAETEGQA